MTFPCENIRQTVMRNKLHINSSTNFILFCHTDTFLYRFVAASVICFPSFISFLFQTKLHEYSYHAKVPDKIEILAIVIYRADIARESRCSSHCIVKYLKCKNKKGSQRIKSLKYHSQRTYFDFSKPVE